MEALALEGTINDKSLTIMILNDGSFILYGGAGWTFMVSTPTPKSVQCSRKVK